MKEEVSGVKIWHRLLPNCPPRLAEAAEAAFQKVQPQWVKVDQTVLLNQAKVLNAFQVVGIGDSHFAASTGYGYSDVGREKIEELFGRTFRGEAALVRIQIASGTHAIACGLFGSLKPGDRLVSAMGRPYDTLCQVIQGAPGSLVEWGVAYAEVAPTDQGQPDLASIAEAVRSPGTRTLFIQRSPGYSDRPGLSIETIEQIIQAAKQANPNLICLVDNCYGEFVSDREPLEVGADLVCGSLIKNPGGGLAPAGGYVIGRADLVERAAARLIAPGIGREVGANLGMNRLLLQGLFLAPHITGEAIKGAQFTAALFEALGFGVSPTFDAPRTDLVQAVHLGGPEALIAFCQTVQRCSPVDAHVRPEPWAMPGYTDPVIMAAGTFIQGSSIELSADGPMRPPYTAFFQGGLTREHVICAALGGAYELMRQRILQ
jgi:cystathionine beta-lyase family protein involved in aluminum resistance